MPARVLRGIVYSLLLILTLSSNPNSTYIIEGVIAHMLYMNIINVELNLKHIHINHNFRRLNGKKFKYLLLLRFREQMKIIIKSGEGCHETFLAYSE